MKTLPLRFVAVSVSFLLAGAASLRAAAVYVNPTNPYSVTVNDSSTVFNTVAGFNGNRADFGGPWGSQFDYFAGIYSSGLQTFSATFQADPGSVFTGVNLGFGQWSFAVPEGGYVRLYLDWNLPGAVYTGSDRSPPAWHAGEMWTVGAGGGHYEWWHGGPQGGGGFEYMPIMDFPSQLLLNNVSSFTISFSAIMYHGGSYFGDGKGAGLGFSNFTVAPTLTAGIPTIPDDPPGSAVSEAGTTVLLLSAGMLGVLGARRRVKPGRADR